MQNYKWARNISLTGGIIALFAVFIPWINKSIIIQVIFGVQSILFFISAYFQHKEFAKENENE